MFTSKFWKQLAERSVKTFAGVLASYFGVDAAGGFDALHANWGDGISLSLGAVVVTVLLGVASAGVGEPNSPSAVPAE